MKSLLQQKGISIRQLSCLAKIPYSTLNDIVNGKTDIDNVRYGYVKSIAIALGLTIDETDALFDKSRVSTKDDRYEIITKNKSFYLKSDLSEKPVYLCRNNRLNSEYIFCLAKWEFNEMKSKEKLANWK